MTLHDVTRGTLRPPDRVLVLRRMRNGWERGSVSCSSEFVYGKTGIMHPTVVTYDQLDRVVWALDNGDKWHKGSPGELGLREQLDANDYARFVGSGRATSPMERSREEGDEQAARDAYHEPYSVNVTGFEFAPNEEDDELDEEEEEDTLGLEPCSYCGQVLYVTDDLFTNAYNGLRYHMRCAIEAESDT